MSIHLLFWYNVNDQKDIQKAECDAHGHYYTLFTSNNTTTISSKYLADKLYL